MAEKKAKQNKKETRPKHTGLPSAMEAVLLRPRITEKASSQSSGHIYVFDILGGAQKKDVSRAVEKVYGFTPVKIRIVRVSAKKVFARGKWGVKRGGKKAYVYLKEGDKIEVI